MMEYKGFVGNIEYDDEAEIFHGEVINTRDVITFQGSSVTELRKAFRESVDDYLAFCAQRGEKPEKPFSGRFVTRINPDLHRNISTVATTLGQSLNSWVAHQLEQAAKTALSEVKVRQTCKKSAANKSRTNGRRRSSPAA
jgi:predicted HicB family RNase H-like nuclease